jgi:hypothetical protein
MQYTCKYKSRLVTAMIPYRVMVLNCLRLVSNIRTFACRSRHSMRTRLYVLCIDSVEYGPCLINNIHVSCQVNNLTINTVSSV